MRKTGYYILLLFYKSSAPLRLFTKIDENKTFIDFINSGLESRVENPSGMSGPTQISEEEYDQIKDDSKWRSI